MAQQMKVIHIHLFLPFIHDCHAVKQERKNEVWYEPLNPWEGAEENGEGKEITNFWGFLVFREKPQQRKWQRCNDLQWSAMINLKNLNTGLSHLPSVDQRNMQNFADTSDLLDTQ